MRKGVVFGLFSDEKRVHIALVAMQVVKKAGDLKKKIWSILMVCWVALMMEVKR